MGKLSFAIVQQKLSSLRDVEEALARQILYGGDLATNLLDQAPSVDEALLTALSAESHGLPPAPPRELPRSSPETLRRVPADIALRHVLYPLEHSAGRLVVAVSEPLSAEVAQDLARALDAPVEQRIAPMVRVRQAIARDYGLPLDRRTSRILAKIEGRPDPSPSLEPPPLSIAPDITALPRPPSMPPFGLAPPDTAPLYAALKPPSERPPKAPPLVSAPAVIRPMSLVPITRRVEPASAGAGKAPQAVPAKAPAAEPPSLPSVPGPVAVAEAPSSRIPGPVAAEAPPPGVPGPLPIEEDTTSVHDRITAEAPPVMELARKLVRDAAPGAGQSLTAPELGAWGVRNQAPITKGRHRGPYTAAAAEQDMLEAEERDAVLAAFFDFARQYFEYSALFVLHGDLAEGRVAYGPGADRQAVAGIGVPLDLPSSLATVRNAKRFAITRLSPDGIDARLGEDLRRPGLEQILLLPVVVRGRCVLIFYGDEGSSGVELSEIGDVIAFAPLVSTALENLILKKKLAVRTAVGQPPKAQASLRPRTHSPQPSREVRVEALAEALGAGPPEVQADADRSPTPSAPRTSKTPPPKPAVASVASKSAPRSAVTPAPSTPMSAPPKKPATQAGRGAASPAPGSSRPSDATPAFPLSRRLDPARSLEPTEDSWDLPVTGRAPPSPGLTGEGPEISIAGLADVELEDLASSDSSVIVATQVPKKRHSSAELKLPKVILNLDRDIESVVNRYLEGDESQLEQLASLGAPAASVLAGRLPGPLRESRDAGAAATASLQGPILRALAAIGTTAAPFVAVRTSDADPRVRLWAIRLMAELPGADAALSVARRIADSDPDVRRAALEAGRQLQSHAEARNALAERLIALVSDEALPPDLREAAVEALEYVREGRGVPALARLAGGQNALSRSAELALDVLTRAHLPASATAWQAWWADNGDRHRIEWLIDALVSEDAATRRAAGEELKTLTKEYFGYYDDLPKKDRERAQRRYREWWEATGKARFST